MNVARVTKIVSACLILAACHNQDRREHDGVGSVSKPGIGIETKAGKMITEGRWCRPLKTDANGVMRREAFRFHRNGTFRREIAVINQDATTTKERLEKGNWAILDGQLMFMLEKGSLRMNYSEYVRTQDGARCLKISPEAEEVDGSFPLCPCDA